MLPVLYRGHTHFFEKGLDTAALATYIIREGVRVVRSPKLTIP